MMQLLKKSDVDRLKQSERQQEIEQGKTLAKKVDTLRELAVNEEESLTNYRNRTVQAIQKEIDGKIAEKSTLDTSIRERKLELARLMQPLDSKWAEVNCAQGIVSKREDNCAYKEAKNAADFQVNLTTGRLNKKKANELEAREEEIGRYELQNAKIRDEADKILLTSKSKAAQKEQLWAQREKELDNRDNSISALSESLQRFNARLKVKEAEIIRREYEALALKLQYESPVRKL